MREARGILERMLTKMDLEKAINTPEEFDIALAFSIQAKNALSSKNGFSPEMLVLGKQTRVPASLASDETTPSHLSALNDTPSGIRFREKLELRERARRAFHAADNDESLRRAIHRRSCPTRGQYLPGEWVMHWKRSLSGRGGWIGPMKVVVQENQSTIWATMFSRIYRISPENARPVTSAESHHLPPIDVDPRLTPIENQLHEVRGQGVTRIETSHQPLIISGDIPESTTPSRQLPHPTAPSTMPQRQTTTEQPDQEPGAEETNLPDPTTENQPDHPEDVPIPEESDSELITTGLICTDVAAPCLFGQSAGTPLAWRQEFRITESDVERWRQSDDPTDMSFLASTSKKQRTEVRLSELSPEELKQFERAKEAEVQNWLKTNTVRRILRNTVPESQIIRCRWILVWKPLDPTDVKPGEKPFMAKARLVVLVKVRTPIVPCVAVPQRQYRLVQ